MSFLIISPFNFHIGSFPSPLAHDLHKNSNLPDKINMSQAKERIIGHMNADHQLALNDYVVVYGNKDANDIEFSSVKITDVDLETLTLEYKLKNSDKPHVFPLKWVDAVEDKHVEVSEYSDLKDKLVSMAHYTAGKQGFAVKQIKTVLYPTIRSLNVFAITFLMILNVYDTSLVHNAFVKDRTFRLISQFIPSFVGYAYFKIFEERPLVPLLVLHFVHLLEIAFFTVPFLRKYRVPCHQRLQWYGMHFFEGFYVILRLKSLE